MWYNNCVLKNLTATSLIWISTKLQIKPYPLASGGNRTTTLPISAPGKSTNLPRSCFFSSDCRQERKNNQEDIRTAAFPSYSRLIHEDGDHQFILYTRSSITDILGLWPAPPNRPKHQHLMTWEWHSTTQHLTNYNFKPFQAK